MGQFNWTPPKDAVPVEDNSTWKPPSNAIPVEKKNPVGNVLPNGVQQSFDGLNSFQSSPVHDDENAMTVVTDPVLRSKLQRQNINPGVEQMAKAADAYKSQLTPQERQSFDNAVAQRPEDAMRASTADELASDKKWDTPMGKLAKGVAYVSNKTGKGGLQIVKGGAWLLNHLNSGFQDTQTIPDELLKSADNAVDKFTGITKTDEEKIENGKDMSTGLMRLGGMLGEFAPTIAGGEISQAPKTMFALQGFGQGKDEIDKADPEHKVNPTVRDGFVLLTGLANAALMGDAAETSFAKMPSALRSKVSSAIAMDALKQVGDKELTGDLAHKLINEGAKDFADNFYRLGTDYVAKVAKTGLDLSALSAANGTLKFGVNKASGTETFENPIGQAAEGISNAMLTQSPILGAVGSARDLSKLTPYSNFKNDIMSDVIADPNKVGEVKAAIEQHGQESGWSDGEVQATNAHIDAIADAARKLPTTIKPEKRADAVELVINRDGLRSELSAEQAKRGEMDESVSDIPTQHEQFLTDKIAQANDKLRAMATGRRTTYSRGVENEDGKFFKTTNGIREEIPPSRYFLEKTERNDGNEQPLIPVETQNGEPDTISETKTGEQRYNELANEHLKNGLFKTDFDELNDLSKKLNKPSGNDISDYKYLKSFEGSKNFNGGDYLSDAEKTRLKEIEPIIKNAITKEGENTKTVINPTIKGRAENSPLQKEQEGETGIAKKGKIKKYSKEWFDALDESDEYNKTNGGVSETENFKVKEGDNSLEFKFKDPEKQRIQNVPIKVQIEKSNFNRLHIDGLKGEFKNMGFGKEIYTHLIDKYGIISTSDYSSSPEAKRLWDSLIKNGKYHWAEISDGHGVSFKAVSDNASDIDRFINDKKNKYENIVKKGEPNAIQESIGEGVLIQPETGNSSEIPIGNAEGGETAGESGPVAPSSGEVSQPSEEVSPEQGAFDSMSAQVNTPNTSELPVEPVSSKKASTAEQAEKVGVTLDANKGGVRTKATAELEADATTDVKKTILTKRAYEGEIQPEVKKHLEEKGLTRKSFSQEERSKQATEFIDKFGDEAAHMAVENGDVDGGMAASVLAQLQIRNSRAMATFPEGSPERAELAKKQADIIDLMEKKGYLGGEFNGQLAHEYQNAELDYANVKKQVEQATGKPLTQAQDKKIKDLTSQNEELKRKAEDAEAKLIDETDKAFLAGKEAAKDETKAEKGKRIATKLRSLKINSINDATLGIPVAIYNGALEASATMAESGGRLADAIEAGLNHIKDSDWYKALSSSKQKQVETDFKKLGHNSSSSTDLGDLQARFVDKTDNKFTPDEARDIWGYMKKAYIENGTSFKDAISKTSEDLGLSWRQISEAITTPKLKRVSDEMWKHQADLARNRAGIKNWIGDQNKSLVGKALQKVSGLFRGVAVFGHGGIFVGTHAGMTLFNPSMWNKTVPAFFRGWKFAYGNEGNYERAIEELKNSPNYLIAQRAGLKNNPERINTEEYQKSQKYLGKLGLAGERGFNAIKVLRQDLFDYHFNKLSPSERDDPAVAKSIAHIANLATGATDLNIPNWVNEASFAGGMEAARWEKLTASPAKATQVALKAIFTPDKATTAERVFAKVWARRVGEQMATYTTALLANAAIQNSLNPKNPVNLTNPNKPDFLKFKFGDVTIDPTSGMRSTAMFIYKLGQIPFESKKELHGDKRISVLGKDVAGYARGKLSPLYGTAADFFSGQDFGGNTMPYSSDKPNKGKHKLGWAEYGSSKLPLPVAEAFNVYFKSAEEHGADKNTLHHITRAIMSGAISGTTGFRVGEYDADAPENKKK